jgi:crotonobetainyl-CoA:carnitine CoA-transferase CaiB-like acyl-CoA transferase
LEAAEVPVGPVLSLDQVFADPQAEHLQLKRSMAHPAIGELWQTGFPYAMSETAPDMRLPPPLLGEHTTAVLGWLGYTEPEIHAMRESCVI